MAATIRTEKRLDITHAPAFEKELKELLDAGEKEIYIDMTDTVYLSSVTLRILLKAQKRINAIGGSMLLKNVSEPVMEVFDVTGFSGILNFEDFS